MNVDRPIWLHASSSFRAVPIIFFFFNLITIEVRNEYMVKRIRVAFDSVKIEYVRNEEGARPFRTFDQSVSSQLCMLLIWSLWKWRSHWMAFTGLPMKKLMMSNNRKIPRGSNKKQAPRGNYVYGILCVSHKQMIHSATPGQKKSVEKKTDAKWHHKLLSLNSRQPFHCRILRPCASLLSQNFSTWHRCGVALLQAMEQ